MTDGLLETEEEITYPFIETEAESINKYLVGGIAIETGSSVAGNIFNSGMLSPLPEASAGWSIYETYGAVEGQIYFNESICQKDKDGYYTGVVYDGMNDGLMPSTIPGNIGISLGGLGIVKAEDYMFKTGGRSLAPEVIKELCSGADGICTFSCSELSAGKAVVGADLTFGNVETIDVRKRTYISGAGNNTLYEPVIFSPGRDTFLTNQPTKLEYVWLIQDESPGEIEIFAFGETATVPERYGSTITGAIRFHNDYGYSVETKWDDEDYLTQSIQWNGFFTAYTEPLVIEPEPEPE